MVPIPITTGESDKQGGKQMECIKCKTDVTHHFAVFCAHPKCSSARPAGQPAVCLERKHHNCMCMACAEGIPAAQ